MSTIEVNEITPKISTVKIDPRMKSKMQELAISKKIDDTESEEFLLKFIEECMTLEIVREKREKKAPKASKETVKFAKVSAYNMFKKTKAEGDWKNMTDEEKAEYNVMAAEENGIRREAAIKKAESGEEEISGDESRSRKTSGYHMFLKSKEEGTWSDMSDEEKGVWNSKADEANKDIVVEKKAKKVDVVYESYQTALRYLRKKNSGEKFLSWKALGLDAKEQWNEFATTKLSEGMNKDLKRDLIVAAADAIYEQLKA